MKIEKGEWGYLNRQKKMNLLCLAGFVLAGVAIFLVGYLWTHTRANIFTVLAILMVLPAAKRIVALVVLLPRKSVGRERYERVREMAGDGILLVDYVFTSTEKIMCLDFLFIKNGNVLAVPAAGQDVEYIKKYLTDSVHRADASFHVQLADSDKKLRSQMERLAESPASPESEQAVLSALRILAV